MGWKDIILGSSPQIQERPLYGPEQMDMLGSMLGRGSQTTNNVLDYYNSILSNDQSYFDAIEKPFIENFYNKTRPAIMNQVGQTAGLRSSALGEQLGEAETDLATRLAALRAGMQGQAASGLQNLMKFGMTPTKQFFNQPGSQGILQTLPFYIGLGGKMWDSYGLTNKTKTFWKELNEMFSQLRNQPAPQEGAPTQ